MSTHRYAPRVFNKRTDKIPPGAVYVGRPSKWGNPFKLGRPPKHSEAFADRLVVIDRYRRWLADDNQGDLRRAAVRELRGKDLVCWCRPLPCHADVLLEIANAD